jgi:hypothetical protein
MRVSIAVAQKLIQSADEVYAAEKKRLEALTPLVPVSAQSRLVAHLRNCWTDAQQAKVPVQARMLACARQRKGEYAPEVLAAILEETEGSTAFIPATNLKCTAAHDYIIDIYNSAEKPFGVAPTPVPDLPMDLQIQAIRRVQQEISMLPEAPSDAQILQMDDTARKEVLAALKAEAKERAERMEAKIDDVLKESAWRQALTETVDDVVTYPSAIMKGVTYRTDKKRTWEPKDDGSWGCVVKDKLVLDFERVSPFDFYPQRNIKKADDGYCFERLRLNRRKVSGLKGLAGYNDTEIDAVLSEAASGGIPSNWAFTGTDSDADEAEERDSFMDSPEGKIDGLEFWGSVPGQWLLDWGMDGKKVPDPHKEYQITAILIGNHVVRAVLNPHPLGKKPYHVVSWKDVQGSIWGQALPEIIAPIQQALNAVVRALINNVAIASGPQLGIDRAMTAIGDDYKHLRPWQVHELDSSERMGMSASGNQLPIAWFQPAMQSEQLIRVIDAFTRMMDEYTGIPSYMSGSSQQTGAADTSSGLAMLMTAAGKIIKAVTSKIDHGFVEPTVERVFDHLMQYDPDNSIKGDASIVATGSGSLIAKEQKLIRMRELMDSSRNDVAMQIIGLPGYAEIMRRVFHAYDLDLDDIIPPAEKLAERDALLQKMIQMKAMPSTANLTPPQPQTLDVSGKPINGADQNVFTPLPQDEAA